MKRLLIIHYSEIGLKTANIDYFVNKLKKFIKIKLEKNFHETFVVNHALQRILINLPKDFSNKDEENYVNILGKIFGIKNFKFTYAGSLDIKKLGKRIFENLPESAFSANSFRVKAKRSQNLPYKSFEAERDVGAVLIDDYEFNKKVNLKNPEFTVDIEFFDDHGYFSYKKHEGAGGLPPNSQSKLVALISSGIDSPVAAYQMMRRGARIIFIHFHGYPYTDKDEMDQAKELVEILSDYQFDTKLYLVPFGKIQKNIATNLEIPAKIRTVLYRRMMLKIAEFIAKKEKAKGIVTGDNFGQVASQTPENMFAIHDASTVPLFQPLISLDKEEIIKIAEKIGTFEISKLPCKDSCSMFMPKHPELKANLYDIYEYEALLPIQEFIETAYKTSELIR